MPKRARMPTNPPVPPESSRPLRCCHTHPHMSRRMSHPLQVHSEHPSLLSLRAKERDRGGRLPHSPAGVGAGPGPAVSRPVSMAMLVTTPTTAPRSSTQTSCAVSALASRGSVARSESVGAHVCSRCVRRAAQHTQTQRRVNRGLGAGEGRREWMVGRARGGSLLAVSWRAPYAWRGGCVAWQLCGVAVEVAWRGVAHLCGGRERAQALLDCQREVARLRLRGEVAHVAARDDVDERAAVVEHGQRVQEALRQQQQRVGEARAARHRAQRRAVRQHGLRERRAE